VLRTDRGGEYTSNAFFEFCKTQKIKHQLTASYSPQQNDIPQRKNRTIVEMARSMLNYRHLPKIFWAEAIFCAACILNMRPTISVPNMTPEEEWSGQKPDVAALRVFRCVANFHVPVEKRKKFDVKGEKCIFIGYSDRTKGYKLFKQLQVQFLSVAMSSSLNMNHGNGRNQKKMQLGFPIDGTAEQGDHQSHDTLQNSSNNSSSSHIDASLSPRNTSACPGQAVVTRTSSQARVLSARLQDYVMTSADDVSNEKLVNFSLFTDCDPFHFVEAS